MTDFRKIERDLIDFFDAAGVDIVRIEGEPFVGATCCPRCGFDSKDEPVSLTKLAERLAGE